MTEHVRNDWEMENYAISLEGMSQWLILIVFILFLWTLLSISILIQCILFARSYLFYQSTWSHKHWIFFPNHTIPPFASTNPCCSKYKNSIFLFNYYNSRWITMNPTPPLRHWLLKMILVNVMQIHPPLRSFKRPSPFSSP